MSTTAMEILGALLVQVVLPLVSAVLLVLVPLLLRRALNVWEAKTGMELSADQESQLLDVLNRAVLSAEHAAAAAVKGRAPALDGSNKLERAVQYVLAEYKRRGWDVAARDEVVRLLEAHLAAMKADSGKLGV